MAKSSYKLGRNAQTGRVVSRGTMTKNGKAIGTATDGTVILEPKLKPKFPKTALRKAVKDVKSKRRLEDTLQAS